MRNRSTLQIVEEQVTRWHIMNAEKKPDPIGIPVITISREPGSGGRLVAEKLAEDMDIDLFHKEVIIKIAQRANISAKKLEYLDEKGISLLEDWIASFYKGYVWPGMYIKHLVKVVRIIGKHGSAVIIGRGCGFILPSEERFRVRIVAPLDFRVKNLSRECGITETMAIKRIQKCEKDQRAFVRNYFYADIENPVNYDLIINTGGLSIDSASKAIQSALEEYCEVANTGT